MLTHPLQYFLQRKLVALFVRQALAVQLMSVQYLVLLVTYLEQGSLAQQVFHLEVDQAMQLAGLQGIEAAFKTGGAAIDSQDGIHQLPPRACLTM